MRIGIALFMLGVALCADALDLTQSPWLTTAFPSLAVTIVEVIWER